MIWPEDRLVSLPRLRSIALLITGLAGPVVACAPSGINPKIPLPGTLAFQDGYLAGCPSGFTDAGRDGYQQDYRKDAARYASEADYRQGWDQGHDACYEEEKRHPKHIPADGHEREIQVHNIGGGMGGRRAGPK